MFNSLHATPTLNHILLTACDLLHVHKIVLMIQYVPTHQNNIADALSRFQNNRVLYFYPALIISQFEPPQLTLGAASN